MKVWAHILRGIEAQGACALVSVVSVDGSAPREKGARMVVTPEGYHGSIGGGALEWQAIAKAQARLKGGAGAVVTSHALGPELGQCCGGRVKLATEVFDASSLEAVRGFCAREMKGAFEITGRIVAPDFVERFGEVPRRLYVFGAGHVGRALVLALAPLPFDILWIDQRPGAFPTVAPANVAMGRDIAVEFAQASFVLAMTHSHALDLQIIDRALRSPHVEFVGVIGSATKRARFVSRLCEMGHGEENVQRLVCPIGIGDVRSKHPAAIALSVATQLVSRDELLRSVGNGLQVPSKPAKLHAGNGT